jgi:hypothetical protein
MADLMALYLFGVLGLRPRFFPFGLAFDGNDVFDFTFPCFLTLGFDDDLDVDLFVALFFAI